MLKTVMEKIMKEETNKFYNDKFIPFMDQMLLNSAYKNTIL